MKLTQLLPLTNKKALGEFTKNILKSLPEGVELNTQIKNK